MKISDLIEIDGRFYPYERDATPEEEAEYERQRRETEERERNRKPTAEERLDAQVTYTAMMTDTMLPEEE